MKFPRKGQTYWMINSRFEVRETTHTGSNKSAKRIEAGNAFKTAKAAKQFRTAIMGGTLIEAEKIRFDKRIAFVYGIITGLLIGFIFAQLFGTPLKPTNAQQSAVFDHSQCQYPDRTTNPANGCDNSDPCDPANVKGGSGECADSAPSVSKEPVSVSTPADSVSKCGGK